MAYLPRRSSQARAVATDISILDTCPRSGGSLDVLVIDDDPDAGELVACMLELSGHRPEVATDGAAGLAKVRSSRPDVVICDIALPDMNGLEVARTIRADPRLASIRLVALSGHAGLRDRGRSLQAGFDAHLVKPTKQEEVLAALVSEPEP